jgi:hypothetical protein
MRTEFGQKVINFLLSFVEAHSVFLPVLRLKSVACFVNLAVRTPFCQGILPSEEITIIHIHLATRRQILRNGGFFFVLSTVSDGAHSIGMIKSMLPINLSVSLPSLRTPAFTQVSFGIQMTSQVQPQHLLSFLVFTFMTLSTFWKIPPLRLCFAGFSRIASKLISWASLSGFWVVTFHGILHLCLLPCTLINQVSCQTLSKVSSMMHAILLRRPYLIVLRHSSTRLHDDDSLAQVQQKVAYQRLIGSIGWLAHTT